ncbi:MAG: thiamine-phosphate kinase [Pseudorhodoplanes sp.]|jgi:thiamine-monophosphate kinase|nr:thiamine-phosphate kinase [Pseudorhodoplanes sp.]
METAEDRLIARFFRPLASHPGALSLADDAAVFAPPEGHEIVLTTDAVVAGVHVLAGETPDAIARKTLRVNLSDLAAKGATPAAFLLSIALPRETGEDWLAAFCSGLRDDADAFGCSLIGGDTDRTDGPLTVTIFALGTLPRGTMVKRSGAQPDDHILVSGSIGDAALGLMLRRDASLAARWSLTADERDHLLARYRLPQPRVAFADVVRAHASAAIDVSDGFVGDLSKLLRVSGMSAEVTLASVPLSSGARKALAADAALRDTIYGGGDDYEIVCTVPDSKLEAFNTGAGEAGIVVADVGRVREGREPPRFLDATGAPLTFARRSFSHF